MSGDYAALAPIYNRIGMDDFAAQLTNRLINYAQQNEWLGRRVLDLGCGTGSSMIWLVEHRYNVVAVDHSPEMLAQARAIADAKSLTPEFIEADIRTLDYGESVDMTLALDVINELENLRELEVVFSKVHGLLNTGKFFVFDLYTTEGLAEMGQAADRLIYNADDLVVFEQTAYNFERHVCMIEYTAFNSEAVNGDWRRIQARRALRAYPISAVATLLRRTGFEITALMNPRMETVDLSVGNTRRVIFFVTKT